MKQIKTLTLAALLFALLATVGVAAVTPTVNTPAGQFLNLQREPFSYRGAAIAIQNNPYYPGIMLSDVSGIGDWGLQENLFIMKFGEDTATSADSVERPELLTFIQNQKPVAEFCFQTADILRIRGHGVPLSLLAQKNVQVGVTSETNAIIEHDFYSKNIFAGKGRYRLTCLKGSILRLAGNDTRLRLVPDTNGDCEAAFEVLGNATNNALKAPSFEACVVAAKADFDDWLAKITTVPAAYAATREKAAYVLWSATINPGGNFKQPAILMSKNWMHYLWSWDHCFNAMALSETMPSVAWDQFMIPFNLQKSDGRLPDMVGRTMISFVYVKPPIHGWSLRYMLAHGTFTKAQMIDAYTNLCRLTGFWFEQRDPNHDGIPKYNHGNDSGWDNGTEFDLNGRPGMKAWRESPNLCAFLVLQMDELHDLALKLGKKDEASKWRQKSDAMLRKMVSNLWTGDRFVTKRADNGEWNKNSESLMAYLPIVLGKKLPPEIRRKCVLDLKNDGYLTKWGLATERPQSPLYQPDGYWRGPIWAPSTLLIVDGLKRAGEAGFAREIAKRFCDLCAKSGFAENFNAQTGAGLRDPAYTWTASVFLILAHDYL